VTGPTILRHADSDIVAAATRDGRILLLDAKSLGGINHATPLHASKTWLEPGATVSADALATWQQSIAGAARGTNWMLMPVAGRPAGGAASANGTISAGAVIALKVIETSGAIAIEPGWVSHDLSAAATPITVNGVVFTLGDRSTGNIRGSRHARRAPRLRRRDRQAAVEQRHGDDHLRLAGQFLDRHRTDLCRRPRRYALRVRFQRRAARHQRRAVSQEVS
jgi:hypothetical protein